MKAFVLAIALLFSNLICGVAPVAEMADTNVCSSIEQTCETLAISEGMENPVDDTYKLKDLDGNIFYVKIGLEDGFMVYDTVAQNFIEKSTTFKSPYDFTKQRDYYYFGPMNYYERIDNHFYSLIEENEIVSIDYAYALQGIFNQQLLTFRNAQSTQAYENYVANCKNTLALRENVATSNYSAATLNENEVVPLSVTTGSKTYINNYQYIRDAKHPTNYDGSCGFVAASLILNYWDKTMHRGTVLPQYLDSNGDLNDTFSYSPDTNLKDRLVQLNGGDGSSWGKSVRDSMISYCASANLGATSAYYLGKIGLDAELANNRPAIIFGALPDEPNSNLVNHAVTAYGIQEEWWGGYYIVNYGWGSTYSEVSLGFGFVGSVTLFQLDTDTYARDYLVQPNDYGFQDAYVSSDTSKTVYANGLSFETNRLRCGYTQSEYITLCPRKAGYGTAYLEYHFTNPVYKIEVNLSFWSDDERYNGSNIAEARIEFQPLCYEQFISRLDLLTANLPTDRTQQKTYTVTFPGGTRYFRFYTHFDYMSGFTDRNKGRISIGDMRIYTYR